MRFLGIDTGFTGGLGLIDDHGKIIDIGVLSEDIFVFVKFLKENKIKSDCAVFLEKAQPFARQGSVSTFSYGTHYGELRGVLKAFSIKFFLIAPQTWVKKMHVGYTDDNPKDRSRKILKKLYPDHDLSHPDKSRSTKMHEGIMDALMIAHYGLIEYLKDKEQFKPAS